MKTSHRTRTVRLSLLALAVGGAIAALALAGPLNPPAGPVTSTYKTLTEVEPRIAISATNTPGDADSLFKITQRGSYYLTGNITGVVGKHGIEIVASGVTLDLMGFNLGGVSGMGAFDGVSVTVASVTDITIRNGSVRAWGDAGVDLGSIATINSAVIDVRASGNTSIGIHVGGGCTINGCSAYNNFGTGISTGGGCTITGCSAHDNNSNGFVTDFGCTITGCSANLNAFSGFVIGGGGAITGCTAGLNGMVGISAALGSTITQCAVQANVLDGISVTSACLVLANTCSMNGNGPSNGAGIRATGADNRIEGNNCTTADRGIDVDGAGNIIIKNTCSGNTIANWDIVANNVVGPILDRTAPASAAILGNSAPSSLGSTDPNANFTY